MRGTTSLVTENEFFSAERQDSILVVRGKPYFTRNISDLGNIDTFFDHLSLISHTDKVKVVVFVGCREQHGSKETMEFFLRLLQARREEFLLQRMFNLVNNYVVAMAGLNKVTIHADTGRLSMFFFTMSLSCDYRIVGEGSVIENAFADIGTVPKGGCGYFLSHLLGVGRATEILRWPSFTAEEALHLGMVDKIVPAAEVETVALRTARLYNEPQIATLLGVRRLLKGDVDELRRSLEAEDMVILNRVNSPEFRAAMKARQEKMAEAAGQPG